VREVTLGEEQKDPDTSFESFFAAQNQRLQRALYVLTGSTTEAEEVAQDAFVALWERWERVGGMQDPVGYLYKSALNRQRSLFRRASRIARRFGASSSTVDPLTESEARMALWEALSTLSLRRRTALVLVDLLGYDSPDAGKLMGISDVTVRRLAQAARAQLVRELGDSDAD
jgi:RNA polymerase sigma factor (sigma-70 family)